MAQAYPFYTSLVIKILTFRFSQLWWLDQGLAKFDRWPFGPVLLAGTLLGFAVGALAWLFPFGWTVSLPVAGLAVGLAWFGRPLGVWPEKRPELLDMVPIKGGRFWMGSPAEEPDRDKNEKQYKVVLDGFLMARNLVTRAQYYDDTAVEDPELPVTKIDWWEAVRFCNRLSKKAGFTSCYTITKEQVTWQQEADGYRLPTEAEWEYAARAGTTTRWPCGNQEALLVEYAWYAENSDHKVHVVGQRRPNLWGLHDMQGNVWEWCWDVYGEYPTELVKNPRGVAKPGARAARVLRGGTFGDPAGFLRSADRFWVGPEVRGLLIGFRCVRAPRHQLDSSIYRSFVS